MADAKVMVAEEPQPQAATVEEPKAVEASAEQVDEKASDASPAKEEQADGHHEPSYPSGLKLSIILVGLCLSVFCVALDTTIIATAIPRISDEFSALQDIGWYGSGKKSFI